MRLMARPRQFGSAGFTLVEVLITIFVTAVGLLTVAGLQAASKKVSYETAQRTAAAALGQDMLERIRAVSSNPVVTPANKTAYLEAVQSTDATAATLGTDCSATAAVCTPAQLAAWDVYKWGQKLIGAEEKIGDDTVGGLVQPTGCIKKVGSKYRVVVVWRSFNNTHTLESTDTYYDNCGSSKDAYKDPVSGAADAIRQFIVIEFV